MKNKKWLALLAAPLMLAACGPSTPGSSSTTPTPGGNVEDIMAGFIKSSAELVDPVKLTYTAKYKVDVISEKSGMDGFKHDVNDTTVAELDLAKGNLYAHVLRNGKDGSTTTKSEALVYKTGADYMFVTTTMENPLKLKDETAARNKINDLLGKVSYNLAGKVTLDSLVYQADHVYEHREFGLNTENIPAEDFATPAYVTNDKGGVKVTADFDYVGYKTDGGISDFPGKDGKPASTLTLDTDAKGRVLSYTQNLNAALAMAIMTPAPLVTINGAKTLTATYGDAVTKLDDIHHQKTEGTLEIGESDKGIIEVYTGVEPTKESCTTKVNTGAKVVVGQYLGVIVKPAGKNTIRNVSNNDVTVVDPKANEMYFFEVQEGKNKIGANYIGNDSNPAAPMGTVSITAPEGVTYKLVSFLMHGTDVSDFQPVGENGKVLAGRWVGVTVTVPTGKEVEIVTCNGKETMFVAGQYCFEIAEAGTYQVVIKLKGEVAPEPEATEATITITAADGITYEARTFKINGMDLEDSQALPANGKVEKGRWLGIKITAPTDKEFVVKCGEAELSFMFGEYCLNLNEAKAYDITIAIKGETPAPTETKATIKITAPEGVTVTAVTFTMTGKDIGDVKPLAEDNKSDTGRWLGLTIATPKGKIVKAVSCGGKGLMFVAGQYCLNLAKAETYEVTIELQDGYTYEIAGLTPAEAQKPLYVWGWTEGTSNSSKWYKVVANPMTRKVSVDLPIEVNRAIVVIMNDGTQAPDWGAKAKQTNDITLTPDTALTITVTGNWQQ